MRAPQELYFAVSKKGLLRGVLGELSGVSRPIAPSTDSVLAAAASRAFIGRAERIWQLQQLQHSMPDPVSVGIAVGVATGAAAIAQSRLQAARDAKAAERDASTISGILKEMSLTTSRVRQGTSAAYGRLASGSTPRRPSLTRRPSAKRVPIFSYGEIAGLSVRLPADGKTCGPKGLLVTDALRGQWAPQCGVQAGARLVSIDGTRLEGLDAAEIRLAASRASRPLWLDVQPGGHAPTGDALSGAHLML